MRYGIALPNYGPLASAATLVRLARRAEERGVDSVWVSDHLVAPTGVRSIYPYDRRPDARPGDMGVIEHFYEPVTTLAYLAGATRRIRLGVSAYVVPYRPALVTAKQIASLDARRQPRRRAVAAHVSRAGHATAEQLDRCRIEVDRRRDGTD